MTTTFDNLKADQTVGRAEALRHACWRPSKNIADQSAAVRRSAFGSLLSFGRAGDAAGTALLAE
jgi:hypothetical protein